MKVFCDFVVAAEVGGLRKHVEYIYVLKGKGKRKDTAPNLRKTRREVSILRA